MERRQFNVLEPIEQIKNHLLAFEKCCKECDNRCKCLHRNYALKGIKRALKQFNKLKRRKEDAKV